MKLKKVVQKDHKEVTERLNAMFAYSKKEMAQALKDYQSNVIKELSFFLGNNPKQNFINYVNSVLEHHITHAIRHQSVVALERIAPIWADLRQSANLHGRLASSFIARKAQPPWFPVKLDLSSPIKKDKVNTRSVSAYYFKKLERLITEQIEIGIKNQESTNDILSRVRRLFVAPRSRYKEADRRTISDDDPFNTQFTEDLFDRPPVELTEGTFTLEDISELMAHQKSAMEWYYTDYNPDMDEALWARNKAFMGLEQDMMTDVVDMVNQGMLTIGSTNMGIDDFVWVVSKPQPECDECTDRDGMTMSEIKDKLNDKYGNKPPRLHPHCRCQLVPQIKDDWVDSQLSRKGYDWNADDGMAFVPTEQERSVGFTPMSYQQWLGSLKGDYGTGTSQSSF